MVNLVEAWETLEEYTGYKKGDYQIISGEKDVELRLTVGKLGFKQKFENSKDQLLECIIKFCSFQNYVKISENIRDEQFFK